MEWLFKSFWELEKRIESQNDFINENLNGFWLSVSKCEEELKEKLGPTDLSHVAASVKDVKYNYEREVELIQNHVNSVEEKIAEINWWVIIVESFSHGETGMSKGRNNMMSPELEVRFKSMEERVTQIAKSLKTQQSLLDLKADNSEMLKFANDKADKQEIL